jgi:hypothetical protein
VTSDQLEARIQRIEEDLRSLHDVVAVLAAANPDAVKQVIRNVFSDPRTVIIYRGIQQGRTQTEIGVALKDRGLKKYFQQDVSKTVGILEDKGFVEKPPKGGHVTRAGWNKYGLEKFLRKTLRDAGIDDLD